MTKTVSFCGISGSGMSALAQILKLSGYEVRGSDRSFDQGHDTSQKQALESLGIKIYPQNGSAVTKDIECLYTSTAVEDSIPDVKAAIEQNIPIKKRFDLLAELFHSYAKGIAVGGTSGKTTTTAMIGYILDVLKQKPCVINGGLLLNYDKQKGIPNYIYNRGDICVIEADESNGSIESYHPYISVINNIGLDHKSLAELQTLFQNFADRTSQGVVINEDCDACRSITVKCKKITFSLLNPQADFYAYDLTNLPDGISYKLNGKTYHLRLIGSFNVSNALAAIAACSLLGIDADQAATTLETFLGTHRRLEVIGKQNGVTVIDDFAHNPDKVLASMQALKSYPGRLLIMFQPHGFSPMRFMGKEIIDSFCRTMDKDDILLMPEIYFAGGTVTRDISSEDFINMAKNQNKQAYFFSSREEIKNFICQHAQPGDRIVIMGARDNTLPDFCREILQKL
ncbi:MAG: UDP-N-acetylmuramate--alanine ligase [Alphaproteobacteria bacterium]|nr:UDP-N-acetylmuramate--alanine ligase [Alphaproteobacteria bacterium]